MTESRQEFADDPMAELAGYRHRIDTWVEDYFDARFQNSVGKPGDVVYEMDRYMSEFASLPAKRVRGALAMKTYEMFGGTDEEQALHVAGTIEVGQNYLLWLDDDMDNSSTRRGGGSMHMRFREYLERRGISRDVERLSSSTTTVASFILAHEVVGLLGETPTDIASQNQLMKIHVKNMKQTGIGQEYDLINGTNGLASEEDIITMYGLKTSGYTIINPMQLGAALAGAPQDDLEALHTFGWHAGIAYQLRDDCRPAAPRPDPRRQPPLGQGARAAS
jgi:geranylgeranyl diphosphate synthase type I